MAGVAGAQDYPIMNLVADKVIQKYQQATCEQLWQQKGQPKTEMELKVINLLRNDPQMRIAFINDETGGQPWCAIEATYAKARCRECRSWGP